MKNRRNIVELKYPPENPNDIWLKDGKFYRSTSNGWVTIDSEIKYTNKESMIADKPKGGTIGINEETGEASIYNDVAKQWSPLGGGGGVISITWKELKDKRDAGKLTPGNLYRITDYQCTTTQENTQSAGHQFDIVLLALSEDKLAEEGWAMMHDNIYDVTFGDGVTKKCYVYKYFFEEEWWYNFVDINTLLGTCFEDPMEEEVIVNEENKVVTTTIYSTFLNRDDLIYNYFQNSNLSAWKVWYCLDNDKDRFYWAEKDVPTFICNINVPSAGWSFENVRVIRDYGADYDGRYAYVVINGETATNVATDRELKDSGDYTIYLSVYVSANAHVEILSSSVTTNGRGVIYRLIDEFNNDVAYDFKNIQYVRPMTDGEYDAQGTNTWCYTFNYWEVNESLCKDNSIIANIYPNDERSIYGCNNNLITIGLSYTALGADYGHYCLTNNVIFESGADVGIAYGASNISIINSCNNTVNNEGKSNIVLKNANYCYIDDENNIRIEGSRNINIQTECQVYYSKSLTANRKGFYIHNKLVLVET